MEAGEGGLVEINGLSFFGDEYKFFRAQDHDLMLLEQLQWDGYTISAWRTRRSLHAEIGRTRQRTIKTRLAWEVEVLLQKVRRDAFDHYAMLHVLALLWHVCL